MIIQVVMNDKKYKDIHIWLRKKCNDNQRSLSYTILQIIKQAFEQDVKESK